MWSQNLPGYAEDRRVLAFDALGDAGMSVQGVPMHSFNDQASWMLDVVSLTLLEPVFTFAYPPADLMAWTMLSSLPGLPDSIRERL